MSEDQTRCLQIGWLTWSVSIPIAISTCLRSWRRRLERLSRSGRCGRALAATQRRCDSRRSRRRLVGVWAVEGVGHYGAGHVRYLSGRGETILEAGRGPRNERRLQSKDDPLDAVRAARTVLASETLALPRAGQRWEALRLLLLARGSAVDVRRQALVQLRAVIVTAPTNYVRSCAGCPCSG